MGSFFNKVLTGFDAVARGLNEAAFGDSVRQQTGRSDPCGRFDHSIHMTVMEMP